MSSNPNETAQPNAARQFLRGVQYFLGGWTLLFQQRSLLWLSLAPVALTLVMLTLLAVIFAWIVSGLLVGIVGLLSALLGQTEVVPPEFQMTLRVWSFLLGLFLAVTFYLPLARVLLAPFAEALSRKTHQLTQSGVRYQSSLGWGRAMWEGVKLVSLQLLVLLLGFGLSLFLPVAGQLLLLALTVVLCGMDFLDVPLSVRGLPLREKLKLLGRHKALVLGFACAAYLCLLIPLINLLSLPVGVVGATLLTDQLHNQID